MELVDTHCHLDDSQLSPEATTILSRAQEMNVTRMISVGTSEASSRWAAEFARTHPGVRSAAGCHPHEADRVDPSSVMAWLKELGSLPQVVGIGETGLDYFKDFSRVENQKPLFRAHLAAAQELSKPLIIHCRDAHADCIEILRQDMHPPIRGVLHCFSGTAENAQHYLELGLYISFAGPITYPNARSLREVVRTIPLDRMVIETDAPYLAPQVRRGKRNEPGFVRFTAEFIASHLGVPLDEFAARTTANAGALFNL